MECNQNLLLFMLPGLAQNADATKNIKDWISFSRKVWETANQKGILVPILDSYHIVKAPEK